ncbi:MAG TPA: TolC family protein [Gemmatimonadales bacterium]|nr:TolC family protein [Gemmatimonadales bacterium]
MRYALSIVGLAVCPALAFAQQPARPVPATLSLQDAIAIAREHSPAYLQALNNRSPAAWGVRSAVSGLFLPTLTASGGASYSGVGSQRFLTSNFSQSFATVASNYALSLDYQLSGATLSQPGLAKADANATEADIAGALTTLTTGVTQQYLTVRQAKDNAAVAEKQLQRNDEFLKLAQARYDVGQATLIDVRQAQVARGQAEVNLLRAQTSVQVEKLSLFELMGVTPPTDIDSVQLTDSFTVQAPPWKMNDLLTMAEQQNPALAALRARERAANWNVRATTAGYGPSLSLSATWSGFAQQFKNSNDLESYILGQKAAYGQAYSDCLDNNTIRTNAGLSPLDCSGLVWGSQLEQPIRTANSVFPFKFTTQPFQARLTITLPIFTDFSHTLQVSQARAQHDNLEESVRARALQVQREVSAAYLNLQTAYTTIAIQDTNRSAASEQLQLATERYRVGSGTFFELLDAQVADLQAEYNYVSAVYDYHKSVAVLEAAVGRPLR